MKGFVEYITDELTTILSEAGGAEAGKLELISTSLNVARSYAKKMFEKGGQDFEKQMPFNGRIIKRDTVEDERGIRFTIIGRYNKFSEGLMR